MTLHIDVVTTRQGVLELVPQWNELLERSCCNRAFSSPNWYLGALSVDPELQPYLVVARHTDITGLLPLVIRGSKAVFASGLADYNDLVTVAGDLDTARRLLTGAVADLPSHLRLELIRLRPDSNLISAVSVWKPHFRFEDYIPERAICHIMDLSMGFEAYLASRTKKFRQEIRRISRRAGENGLTTRALRPDTLPAEMLPDLFLSLHGSRFQSRSVFADQQNIDFVKEVLPGLFLEKRLLVKGMFVKDQLAGLKLFFKGVDSLCEWNGGFLSQYSCHSPGHLLTLAGLHSVLESGWSEYDLLRGVEPYKKLWSNATRSYAQFSLHSEGGLIGI